MHPVHPAHILIIDDDPDVLAVIDEILTEEGYRVTCLASVRPPDTRSIADLAPDVIITDSLGTMTTDVVAALAWWHLDPQVAHIPLVLCTGAHHQIALASFPLAKMGVPVVRKPFDIDELLIATATALRVPR
jgi:CheY-like chemotaxis protein